MKFQILLLALSTLFLVAFTYNDKEISSKIMYKGNVPDSLNVSRDTIYIDSVSGHSYELQPFKSGAVATYYADRFNGRKTASGQVFNNSNYTAAHRELPFGTMLRVTNEANQKSVVVTVNDRGPFIKGKEIDLSKKAFREISRHHGHGTMKVTIEVLTPMPD